MEAVHGKPFVGPSGDRLSNWIYKAEFSVNDFYYLNLVQCWLTKPGKTRRVVNREPTKEETAHCWTAHVRPQLERLTNLRVIVPVGMPSAEVFLGRGCSERDLGTISGASSITEILDQVSEWHANGGRAKTKSDGLRPVERDFEGTEVSGGDYSLPSTD
jgi:uracil-DNA glycosylase family 4